MLNTQPATSTVRTPRGLIQINGVEMTGWERWSVDQNVYHDPDKCSVSFAASGLPEANGVEWWASQTDLVIEIFDGFPVDPDHFNASELTSRFYGKLDEVSVAWDGLTIDASGRDLSAQMVDTKTQEKYRNSTASQVATALAAKYELTPKVTATTGDIGRFYARDHIDLTNDRTEWDLLTWLARQEGFITYVKGKELHFEPLPSDSTSPYVVEYRPPTGDDGFSTVNAVSLKTTRVLTVAKDISVTVSSFNGKAKKAYTRKAVRTKAGSKSVQEYSYTIPGLTPEQCQARANQILDELSRHEVRLEMSGPADNVLGIGDVIQLKGTATAFDQTFHPDNIHRDMSFDGGYAWTVTAKNHSTNSEPTA